MNERGGARMTDPEIMIEIISIEKQLDTLAKKAWAKGYKIRITSHDGHLTYYTPRYPKTRGKITATPASLTTQQ